MSMSLDLYTRLKAWCEVNERSMSSVVEESVRQHLNLARRSEIRDRANASREPQKGGNVFTF